MTTEQKLTIARRICQLTPRGPEYVCLECGHKFRTARAAERAAFGDDGCPDCGGTDIDLAV